MAQIFVGTNNINLLSPNGQFGTRIQGGEDASSPRYIYTMISKLTRLIYKEEDIPILNYLDEDGLSIEPDYYVPIITMVLVNVAIGIGTGYSTNVPQYNPEDIINIYLNIIQDVELSIGSILTQDDIGKVYEKLQMKEFEIIEPYYLGFKGTIYKNDKGNYQSKGVYKWIDNNTIEITELPIGTWTENYKEGLEEMITKGHTILKSFESHYTSKNVKFILKLVENAKETLNDEKILNEFKLVSSKNLSLNNLHLFTTSGNIMKYENIQEIMLQWCYTRIWKYYERKEKQLKTMEDEYLILSNKIRFIIDVIEGNIVIMNKKLKDVEEQLIKRDYNKFEDSYNYLLQMPIYQLTTEKKENLEKEVHKLKKEIDELREMSIMMIWKKELTVLLEEWKKFKTEILEDYENDLKGNTKIVKKTKGKK
jgi:DNA topoisomerase-2